MDGGKDGPLHRTGDRDFGQLEGDGAGVAHDASADLDQFAYCLGRKESHFLVSGWPHKYAERPIATLAPTIRDF
jgi:hypothetical protein